MVLERLSWHMKCPNDVSFRLLKVARGCSCKPTRKFILLGTQSLVLCSKQDMQGFLRHLVSNAWTLSQSQQAGSMSHSHKDNIHIQLYKQPFIKKKLVH